MMHAAAHTLPGGSVGFQVIRRPGVTPWESYRPGSLRRDGLPRRGLSDEVNRWRAGNAGRLIAEARKLWMARRLGIPHMHGALFLSLVRDDGSVLDYGLGSLRLVTDTGVGYIVDAFQNTVELENMKFHGFGTGTTAENASQTGLVTELTTQYAGDVRPTGSTTEGSGANVYRTVATLSPDSGGTIAVTEHGVFSASSAGVMLDRSVFSAVNVVASADSLQATYDFTLTSGG